MYCPERSRRSHRAGGAHPSRNGTRRHRSRYRSLRGRDFSDGTRM